MAKRWLEVATIHDIDDDEVLQVELDGFPIALYKLAGRFLATADECFCKKGVLSEGFVEDNHIVCPECDGAFEIKTGCKVEDRNLVLKRYPAKIVNGLVVVGISVPDEEE